ncbi:MAG: hypothetical protein ACKVP7_26185 [Hyphomicrobiaceae bacterium]
MRTFLSTLGIGAALVMSAVSASMNYVFLASLGKTPLEGQILGAASAAADLLKALLPFFIAWAWNARRIVAATSGCVIFLLFASFSLLSAIGFAADNRGVLVENRAAIDEAYARAQTEYDRMQAALATLPAHRPEGVIAEDLRSAEQNRLWARSRNCAEASEIASREFCAGYFRQRGELAAAQEAQRLSAAITVAQAELSKLKIQGAGQERDPQVTILAKLMALPSDYVRLALIVFVALVVEFGSSMGLYLASGHGSVHRDGKGDEAPTSGSPALIEARRIGSVEDFVLEALVPMPAASITDAEILASYEVWCEGQKVEALDAEQFAARFAALARAVGLRTKSGRYLGIAIKTSGRLAA